MSNEIINPDFVPFTTEQYAVLDAVMQTMVLHLITYCEPPFLGDGNLEMMTEDLLYRALKALVLSGKLYTDDGHTFELRR